MTTTHEDLAAEVIAAMHLSLMSNKVAAKQCENVNRLAALASAAHGEPVAWQGVHDHSDLYWRKPTQADVRPLYTRPTAPAEPADPVTEVAALPDVSDLLTWAVEDGLIRLSRVFDPDLQDAITKFATRLAALQANDTTKGK